MKRSLVLLVALTLLLAACASTATTPTTTGVITEVNGTTVTIAGANGAAPATYMITRSTNIYSPDGVLSVRSYLTPGQRVMVWAEGTQAVRINIAS